MSGIRFLIAVTDDTFQRLKDNFRLVDPDDPSQGYVHNDLTDAERRALRNHYEGKFASPTLGGTKYHVLEFYATERRIGNTDKLFYVEYLPNKWPGKFIIVGVWNKDGSQYGTTIVPPTYDIDGTELTPQTVEGTPVYPIPAAVTPERIMPPVNGQPATEFVEMHKKLGWANRRWN